MAARIRELIMSGQVKPGEFLRLERLATECGISVTPVREALQSLRSEGFVVLAPRRGFVVAELSRQDVEDLFWVQAMISAELTARATRKLTAQDLTELQGVHERMAGSLRAGDLAAVEDCNDLCHRIIDLASGARRLAWMFGAVNRYFPPGFYGRIPGWPEAALEGHTTTLQALRDRNAESAAAAMRAHIMNAGKLLVAHLERQGLWD